MDYKFIIWNVIENTFYDGSNTGKIYSSNFDPYAGNAYICDTEEEAEQYVQDIYYNGVYGYFTVLKIYDGDDRY